MNDTKPMGESLLQTIANTTEYKDVLADISEVAIDSILEDGVIRDIPVIGSLVGLARGTISIRDRIYAKKILRFLLEFKDIPTEEIQSRIDKLATDPKERQRLGEHLLLLLDRLNDMGKPALLSKAFLAFLEQRINRVEFQGLAHAIDVILLDNIGKFKEFMQTEFYVAVREADPNFLQAGLMEIYLGEIDITPRLVDESSHRYADAGTYRASHLGKLFYEEVVK